MNNTNTHSRAKAGGEFGANGEWYEGGKFINTVPENGKRQGSTKSKPVGKREIDSRVWAVQPAEGAIAIYPQLAGIELREQRGVAGSPFRLNPDLRGEFTTAEAIAKRENLIARFNAGERWV